MRANANMMIYLGEPGSGQALPITMSGAFTDQGVIAEETVGEPIGQRTVIQIVSDDRHIVELTVGLAGDAVLGVAVVFAVWWLYFDFVARRPPRATSRSAIAWGYLHLPFVMAAVTMGAGIENVLAEGSMSSEVRVMIAAAAGALLVTLGLLELTLERYVGEPTHPRLSPGIKIVVGLAAAAGTGLPLANSTVLLVALLLSFAIPAVYGAWVWFAQPASAPTLGREEI